MGAAAGHGWDADRKRDLAILVASCAQAVGDFEVGRVEIFGGEGEILVEVSALERVGVAARGGVWGGLGLRVEGNWWGGGHV